MQLPDTRRVMHHNQGEHMPNRRRFHAAVIGALVLGAWLRRHTQRLDNPASVLEE